MANNTFEPVHGCRRILMPPTMAGKTERFRVIWIVPGSLVATAEYVATLKAARPPAFLTTTVPESNKLRESFVVFIDFGFKRH